MKYIVSLYFVLISFVSGAQRLDVYIGQVSAFSNYIGRSASSETAFVQRLAATPDHNGINNIFTKNIAHDRSMHYSIAYKAKRNWGIHTKAAFSYFVYRLPITKYFDHNGFEHSSSGRALIYTPQNAYGLGFDKFLKIGKHANLVFSIGATQMFNRTYLDSTIINYTDSNNVQQFLKKKHVESQHDNLIDPALDIRPYLNVRYQYNHLNVDLYYSRGITNYFRVNTIAIDGLDHRAYAQSFGVVLSYRFSFFNKSGGYIWDK